MAITAECSNCHRRYQAPDNMAGKRVRCKQCGTVFQVPAPEGQDEQSDLDALAALEQSHHSLDVTATGVAPGEHREEDSEDSPAPVRRGRSNVRFGFAFARELDQWLPMILVVGSLALLGSTFYFQNDPGAPPWIAIVRIVAALIGYAAIIAPITLVMIRKAGANFGYQMPVGDRWRAFAAYMPALAVAAAIWITGDGALYALILGGIAGITIATLGLWLLFRLRPHEIAPSAAVAGLGFFVGLAIVGGIFFGLNVLLLNVMVSLKDPTTVPASPFGPGLAWITSDQRDKLLAAKNPPKPVPKPQPTQQVQQPPTTPQPQPTQDNSSIVRSMDKAPLTGSFDEALHPLTDSPFICVISQKDNMQTVQLWDSDSWTKKSEAQFRSNGQPRHYILSPDGLNLAWIASFPHLSIQVWNFNDNSVSKLIDLDEKLGNQDLIGFTDASHILLHWQQDSESGLQVADINTGQAIKINTPATNHNGVTLAISPNGHFAAVTAKDKDQPSLLIYDLSAGKQLSSTPLTSLDPSLPITPTGLAFSFDSNKVAILFEQNGNGLLLAYQIDKTQPTATKIAEHLYPNGVMPLGVDTQQFTGNALAWLPDGKSWLLYGEGVFDLGKGKMVAELGQSKVETSTVVSPDTVELVGKFNNNNSNKQITLLHLDMDKVAALLNDSRN